MYNTTQFFISNSGSSETYPRGQFHEHLAIKSLDIHPMTNQLYAVASGSQQLYQVRNGAQDLVSLGEKMEISEIEALAFHPDGNLWGWSEAEGLFKIENGENNEPDSIYG